MNLLETIEKWEKNGTGGAGTYSPTVDRKLREKAPDMAKALKAAVELAEAVDAHIKAPMGEVSLVAMSSLIIRVRAFREAMG